MATASTPSLWARSMQVETTFLCPLCMPSKLPMVTTLASLPGMSEREYQTFMSIFLENQDGTQASGINAKQAQDSAVGRDGGDRRGFLLGRGLRGVADLGRPLRQLTA